VFAIDDRVRGVPAAKEHVIGLYQSINQPHVAIPGKQAGPAQAFILGVRGSSGFAIFVYLYLAEVGDCAVYPSERRNLSSEDYAAEEQEAIGFVESMGFMMDNTNFRALPPAQQDELVKTLPVFQKEPKRPAAAAAPASKPGATAAAGSAPAAKPAPAASLGKLFTSF
jgi:hypothetical protein